jgi:hypothetical protein
MSVCEIPTKATKCIYMWVHHIYTMSSKALKAEEYFKEYKEIEVTKIEQGPYDTRLIPPDTKGIATSIRNRGGTIEPPTVVEKNDFAYGGENERYVSTTGHIRIRETQNEGHAKIFCKVYRGDMPEDLRYFTALESNIHNHRLGAVELGAAILKASAMFKLSTGELGEQLGIPSTKINQWIAVKAQYDSVPDEFKEKLLSFDEREAFRVAYIIQKIPEQERQIEAIQKTNGLSPKEAKDAVDEMLSGGGKLADIVEKVKKESTQTVNITIQIDKNLDWLLQQEAAKAHIKRKSLFIVKILRDWSAEVQAQTVPN